jgi:crotonobetainyl-CoA:carnitine CoA-transferase CaiB-like acyl-CoA transferase
MTILWDGEKFFHELDTAKAQKMVEEGRAQNAAKEDGFSLKYKHQFSNYTTRELRAETKPAPAPPAEVQAPPKPIEEPQAAMSAPAPEVDWEAHREDFKAATGALRARKDSVIEWMKSEGRL